MTNVNLSLNVRKKVNLISCTQNVIYIYIYMIILALLDVYDNSQFIIINYDRKNQQLFVDCSFFLQAHCCFSFVLLL